MSRERSPRSIKNAWPTRQRFGVRQPSGALGWCSPGKNHPSLPIASAAPLAKRQRAGALQELAHLRHGVWVSFVIFLLLTPLAMLRAQDGSSSSAPNHVLELDGDGDYVELPGDAFSSLEAVTVEAWVKWDRFQNMSRVFAFALKDRLLNLQNRSQNPDLWSEQFSSETRFSLQSPGVLRVHEWVHVALAMEPAGMKLYLNGVALNDSVVSAPNTFRSAEFSRLNLLGRGNSHGVWEKDQDFLGEIDDVRVWSGVRTEAEIRRDMFQELTGREPGLVGWWDFEQVTDGIVKDRSAGRHDGKLVGQARVIEESRPTTAPVARLDRVLNLPGTSGFVELPSKVFDHLTDATVEGWVKWDEKQGRGAHFFDFGNSGREIYVGAPDGQLKFLITGSDGRRHRLAVDRLIRPGEWNHVAAVSGRDGMKLYLNGTQVASDSFTGSFSGLEGVHNYLGRANGSNSAKLHGQIDEVRVWSTARSPGEIRALMFKELTGEEPGLAGYWKFDQVQDGVVKDASPGGHDGRLVGAGSIVTTRLPVESDLPYEVRGTVIDSSGRKASFARIVVVRNGNVQHLATADFGGDFRVQLLEKMTLDIFAVRKKELAKLTEISIRRFATARADLKLEPSELHPEATSQLRDALVEALSDRTQSDRALIIAALSELQVSDLGIAAGLVRAMEDPEASCREAALRGLRNLPIPSELEGVFQKRQRGMALFIVGLLVPLVGFHLVLYFFFPQAISNLYYALFVAAATVPHLIQIFATDSGIEDARFEFANFCVSALIALLGLRLVYCLFSERLPIQFWIFLGLLAITTGSLIIIAGRDTLTLLGVAFGGEKIESAFPGTDPGLQIRFGFTMIFGLGLGFLILCTWAEMLRVMFVAISHKIKGAWMIGLGLLSVLVFNLLPLVARIFFEDFYNERVSMSVQPWLANFGMVFFVAWTSIYLASHFAEIHTSLTAAKSEIEAQNEGLQVARQSAEEARAAADEANRTKSQFLANMSHELRTPMNAIIGYSEMLQEEAEDLDQKEFIPDLQKIHGAGKHLLGLINDILDLSKVEAGKMTLYLEEFEVTKLIQEVAATVQPLVSKNTNTLVVECPEDIGVMTADVTKLRQTLFNLLSNASKFTENGTVTLRVRKEEGELLPPESRPDTVPSGSLPPSRFSLLHFSVMDTGIGMSPGQMGRLFQAFSQADASTTRKFGGTGLGLAISKKFCQMMGGDIAVDSEPGVGTTFTATLPREVTQIAPTESAAAATPTDPRSATHSPRSTVLVIDDDSNVRDLMQRTLVKDGFHVEVAVDGQSGLALARALHPAVITLDVMMPGMDGWAVLTALKADPETADIPVVMLTIVDDRNMGFSLGAADYFTKPIDWHRLSAALKKHRRPESTQTVLVVEDDGNTREMLRRSMEKDGWSVLEADNGRMGLERLGEGIPAIILLDLMMPEMDGFTFMEELRQLPECAEVPVIVITAKDLTAEDHRRLNGEVSRILQKGATSSEQLLTEVRTLLARETLPPA